MGLRFRKNTYETLNMMLDEATSGKFQESDYDESELSKLEVKWKRFLGASALSRQNVEKEKKAVKELVSDISHQVKTPISNIRLYGEIIEEKLEGEDKELAKRLMAQTDLLESLIQSLVKMSRLETNIIQVSPQKQPLKPMLEELVLRGKEKQVKRGIQIVKKGWTDECQACFDRKWTSEAVYNILDNALKYTEEKSCVTVAIRKYPMFVSICIQDEGPGITEEEIPKIFQRFYRGSQFQEKEGVGLGLYLAREILKKEHGYIKVSTTNQTGASFAVYLPRENFQNC